MQPGRRGRDGNRQYERGGKNEPRIKGRIMRKRFGRAVVDIHPIQLSPWHGGAGAHEHARQYVTDAE